MAQRSKSDKYLVSYDYTFTTFGVKTLGQQRPLFLQIYISETNRPSVRPKGWLAQRISIAEKRGSAATTWVPCSYSCCLLNLIVVLFQVLKFYYFFIIINYLLRLNCKQNDTANDKTGQSPKRKAQRQVNCKLTNYLLSFYRLFRFTIVSQYVRLETYLYTTLLGRYTFQAY